MFLLNEYLDTNTTNLFNNIIVNDTQSEKEMFCRMLALINGDKWKHLYNLYVAEYNALENFNRTEENTETENVNIDDIVTGTLGNTTNIIDNSEKNNSTYAYNSSEPQPTETENIENGGTTTSNGTTASTQDKTETRKKDNNNKMYGNIGVTTTQQMYQQEIDLFSKYSFLRTVMQDIENNTVLGIYEEDYI